MKLIKILKYLDKKFPEKTMAAWDKSGLQIYDRNLKIETNQDIKKIFITLDLSKAAFENALGNHADLIITRHPFIFNELNLEKNNPQKAIMIKQLLAQKVLIYSIHTNYDVSPQNSLISLINQKFELRKSFRFGANKEGWVFIFKQKLNPKQFQKIWKELFPNQYFNRSKNWLSDPLKEFCFVSGAGGDTMVDSNLKNTTFVTGELKWHHWLYALDNQVQVLALGHEMEDHFVSHLNSLLANAYSDLEITTYNHKSPFSIMVPEV